MFVHLNLSGVCGSAVAVAAAVEITRLGQRSDEELVILASFFMSCFGSIYDRIPPGKALACYATSFLPLHDAPIRVAVLGVPLVAAPLALYLGGLIIPPLAGDGLPPRSFFVGTAGAMVAAAVVFWLTAPLRTLPDSFEG